MRIRKLMFLSIDRAAPSANAKLHRSACQLPKPKKCSPDDCQYVSKAEGRIVGMYKIVQNHRDLGSHIANASFMVAPSYRGRGAGRRMGLHALREARQAGFLGMQFNFVVSTNASAVALWQSLGFAVVGTLPKVFKHAALGYVDAYVMYRSLKSEEASSP